MTSKFMGIVAALVTALQAGPAVSSQVDRAQLRPVKENQSDAVVVRLKGGPAERFGILGGPIDWDTEIDVEVYARSSTLTADAAVDAVLVKVYARISADPTLAGLVMDLQITGIEWDFATAADQLSCATVTLKALHRTQNLTLE